MASLSTLQQERGAAAEQVDSLRGLMITCTSATIELSIVEAVAY